MRHICEQFRHAPGRKALQGLGRSMLVGLLLGVTAFSGQAATFDTASLALSLRVPERLHAEVRSFTPAEPVGAGRSRHTVCVGSSAGTFQLLVGGDQDGRSSGFPGQISVLSGTRSGAAPTRLEPGAIFRHPAAADYCDGDDAGLTLLIRGDAAVAKSGHLTVWVAPE